jgi:hypothetical protein
MPSAKANATAAQLKSDLVARGFTVVAGQDASLNPTLAIGAQATGEQNAFLRLQPLASINLDILGLAQNVFTPHVLQIALETSASAGLPFLTPVNFVKILGESMKTGMRVEVYMRTTGTLVDVDDITAANLLVTWDTSMQYPLAGQ